MHIALSLNLTALDARRFDRAELGRIMALLARSGALPLPASGRLEKGGRFTARSQEDLSRLARQWPDGRLVQLQMASGGASGTVSLFEARGSIDLSLAPGYLDVAPADLLKDLVQAIEDIAADGSKTWRARESSGVSAMTFAYPRPRPPRQFAGVYHDVLVDILDRREPASEAHAKTIDVLADGQLPSGAARSVFGPVIVIDWAEGVRLSDVSTLRARLTDRELWLARNLSAPLPPEWNAAGDIKHGFLGARPAPPLTLYSDLNGVGYKAVHGSAPPAEIEATLRTAAGWRAAHRVEAGPEVTDVVIIADSRATALALRPQALELGLQHIVYPDDAGDMWDPFPDGEWIYDG